jgi:hypothetical protein
MKRCISGIVLLILVVFCGTPLLLAQSFGSDQNAGPGQSEIIINGKPVTVNSSDYLNIYLDGMLQQTMHPKDSIKLVVNNGQHTILVEWMAKGGMAYIKGEPITINTDSKRYIFTLDLPSTVFGKVKLITASVTVLSKEATTATGVEKALARAAESVSIDFTPRTRIAIVQITAPDRSTRDFIIGELEYILQQQGYYIVDRAQLDRIFEEQRFSMSGDVDDRTAARVGKIAGASVVITGRVDGEGNLRRLRLRALNTETAQVIGTASERL